MFVRFTGHIFICILTNTVLSNIWKFAPLMSALCRSIPRCLMINLNKRLARKQCNIINILLYKCNLIVCSRRIYCLRWIYCVISQVSKMSYFS